LPTGEYSRGFGIIYYSFLIYKNIKNIRKLPIKLSKLRTRKNNVIFYTENQEETIDDLEI